MNLDEQINFCKKIMTASKACYLTTINPDGMPETRAMLNLRNDKSYPGLKEIFDENPESFIIYFTTNTSSVKVKQMNANPNVSVYYCLPDEFKGVMANGKIEIIDDPEIKKRLWVDGWEIYYHEGKEDPDYTVLRLIPESLKAYGNLGTFTIKPGDR